MYQSLKAKLCGSLFTLHVKIFLPRKFISDKYFFLDGTSELIADRTVSWYIEYLAVPVRNKSGALNTNKRCWNNDDMIFDTKYVKMIDIDIINSLIINN